MTLLERFLAKRKAAKAKALLKEAREGQQAGLLLRDGIFTQVIDEMRDKIIDAWRQAPVRDIDGQHELKIMLKVLDDLVKRIEDAYVSGELAQKQLDDERKKKQRN